MKKTALITGITGQDGSYLAELLLSKDYRVFGSIRRHSIDGLEDSRIGHILKDIDLQYADLTDLDSIQKIINKSKPNEVYNLASQSDIKVSYDNPIYTANTIAVGTLNLLESIKQYCPKSKIFLASSSEIFGNCIEDDGYQRETTKISPTNPYGCARAFSYYIGSNYRNSYNMHVSSGILFNHESPRRGENFVSTKIVKAAVNIYNGKQQNLVLGTLDIFRDWGHAKDYVEAMWSVLQLDNPDDYIISTGKLNTLKYVCEYVFNKLGMSYEEYVKIDDTFSRPQNTIGKKGDYSKLKSVTGWYPKYSLEDILDEMIEYYITIL